MSGTAPSARGPVRPLVALAFATMTFVALVIFSFGMLSLVLDEDVIETPGIGQGPGVIATVTASAVFAGTLWSVIRTRRAEAGIRPSFANTVWIALATALSYAGVLWVAAVATGTDVAAAAAVAGRVVTSWYGVAVALVAAVCAWGAIALVRTRAGRPRWPWEDDEEP